MKTIFLIRHAKSSWDNNLLKDHQRPLNKKGLSDAPIMGERLKQEFSPPERIICSSAQRAKETAEIIKGIWFPQKTIEFTDLLYEQQTSNILSIIQKNQKELNSLALFFHNPTITHLGNLLASLSLSNIPTCGALTLSCKEYNWAKVEIGNCGLVSFNYPKKIKGI
jgi:phosphohistidine phosphatase